MERKEKFLSGSEGGKQKSQSLLSWKKGPLIVSCKPDRGVETGERSALSHRQRKPSKSPALRKPCCCWASLPSKLLQDPAIRGTRHASVKRKETLHGRTKSPRNELLNEWNGTIGIMK